MKAQKSREGSVQIADWWEGLLWPRVLGAAALGVRPGRVGIAFFGLVTTLVLLNLGVKTDTWLGMGKDPLPWHTWPPGNGLHLLVWRWFIEVPAGFLRVWPASTILFIVVVWPTWLVIVGAISRISAVEFAKGQYQSWTQGLAFGMSHRMSLLAAMIGPLLIVWGIALFLGAFGWVLLQWPGANILGGVLYGLAVILGIVGSLIGVTYALGHSMLVPAVMCEGADAIDSIQRAYAYTLDRPVRLIIYLVLASLGLAFTVAVIAAILGGGVAIAYKATGVWAGESTRSLLWNATFSAIPFSGWKPPDNPATGTAATASWLIRLWTMIPVYALAACYISCSISCSTVVYLCMRRLCDGQDTSELWMPGMIEGVMTESLAGRAKAAGFGPIAAETVAEDEPEES